MRFRSILTILQCLVLFSFASGASGELDRSFGSNGRAFFDSPFNIDALAVQSDDKFLGGGRCQQAEGLHFCITRFNANGTIDTSFGSGGAVYTPMTVVGSEYSSIVKLLVQADGRIIAAGYTDRDSPNFRYSLVAIARYMPDGSIDTSFAGGGKFFDTASSQAQGLQLIDAALQSDGKLVMLAGNPSFGMPRVVLMRLNTDGSLDQTFGTGGRANRDFGTLSDIPGSIAVGPDGKIIVGGRTLGSPTFVYVVERYLSNAAYDSSAGQNGRVKFSDGAAGPLMRKITVLPDGSTLAMGSSYEGAWPRQMFAKFRPDLTFDTSFNGSGRVSPPLTPEQNCDSRDLLARSDGKVTFTANCIISSSTFYGANQELGRLTATGQPDKQFGIDGHVAKLHRSYTGNVITQTTGKIVVCGRTTSESGPSPGLYCERYLDNGTRESDFDADKRADVAVFRPSTGTWYSNNSSNGFKAIQFGAAGDRIVPADYDGDGTVDHAVFRAGVWYQLLSGSNSFQAVSFGYADDTPIAADYSGDGRADIAVFRARGGDWYFLDSATGQASYTHFGSPGDKPLAGNFDGDLKADPAVYRNGTWFMLNSLTGFTAAAFGLGTDKPVPADYDGDGATDLAVYRNGVWYVMGSFTGFRALSFGLATDRPAPADFDGDGRADIAVYRDGIWYLQRSTAGFAGLAFGTAEDVPVSAAFLE